VIPGVAAAYPSKCRGMERFARELAYTLETRKGESHGKHIPGD
jgi:hypothetical protein